VRLINLKRKWLVPALMLLFAATAAEGGSAVRAAGDDGRTVALDAPARRIVSLSPHLTEILFAIGAGDQVVAVSDYSDFPPPARLLPRVGSALQIHAERLLLLKPDLVAAWGSGTPGSTIERLRSLGITVFVSEPRRLEDVASNMRRLGALTGHAQPAAQAAQQFMDGITALRRRYGARATVSVFFEIEHRPLMTLGGTHIFNDLLHSCGGSNVFADADTLAPTVGLEAVVARDPDVVLVSSSLSGTDDVLASWRARSAFTAVRTGQIYAVPADLVVRHGPRLLEGAEMVCRLLDRAREARNRDQY
jgi:iron complex transport system substrate-binding protein